MRANVKALLVTLLAGVLLGPLGVRTAIAAEDPPEVSFDGLCRVEDSKLALVYAIPDVDLSGYSKVGIMEVEVAFKKKKLEEGTTRGQEERHGEDQAQRR